MHTDLFRPFFGVTRRMQAAIRQRDLCVKDQRLDRAGKMAKHVRIKDASKAELDSALDQASSVLKCGGVIAVPTETVYGIATIASSDEGIDRVYAIKGRDHSRPVAICLSKVEEVESWAKQTVSSELLNSLLPGPVTVVLERTEALNPHLNRGTRLVGIRVPDYPFIRRLVERCGCPLALTSANISSTRSTLAVEEFTELWPVLDLVVDGGRVSDSEGDSSRRGSTVVDLSQAGKFSVIREGSSYADTVKLLRDTYGLTESIS